MSDALAQIYARSLYELAEEAGGREKIFEIAGELEDVCELARGNKELSQFLASPVIDRHKRGESLGRVFRDRVTDLTLRFLLVVNDKGRLGHLEHINTAFDRLVQLAHDRIEVDVFTAAPIGDDQLRAIGEKIRTAIGKEAVLHPYTDNTMLGGLKLRIGDQLIDGSVSTRLRRLRQRLATSGSAKIRERFDRIIENGDAS